jgi:hypothetical protein
MSNQDYTADLAQLDDVYKEVEPAEKKELDDVPPGRYQAFIDRVYLDRAKTSGRLMLKWELVVAVGDYKGRRLFRNNMVETPDNMRWLKADLQTAGVTIERLSDLPIYLDSLINVMLDVTVSTKGKGDQASTNVYINKRVDRAEETNSAAKNAPKPAATQPARSGGSRGLSNF